MRDSSQKRYILQVPWPPSVNHATRIGKGRRYLTAEARLYKKRVKEIVAENGLDAGINNIVRIRIVASPPDWRKRDIDNLAKVALDALVEAGVLEDDKLVDRLTIERACKDASGMGYLHITIEDTGKKWHEWKELCKQRRKRAGA